MPVRDVIFDSRAENELYKVLEGAWEPHLRIYVHLPFSSVIDPDAHRLSAGELNFLNRTSIDFVLVTRSGRPVAGLEFDGLGSGFARDGRYHPTRSTGRDPSRSWKLGLKARVAEAEGFPLLIVSYEEAASIDRETGYTLVHGLLGHVIGEAARKQACGEALFSEEEAAHLEKRTREERYDVFLGRIAEEEAAAQRTYNPLWRLDEELTTLLTRRHGRFGWELRDFAEGGDAYPPHTFRLGCEARLEIAGQTLVRTVWMRPLSTVNLDARAVLRDVASVLVKRAALDMDRRTDGAREG